MFSGFSQLKKYDLLSGVKNWLLEHPEDAPEFLEAVKNGMNGFKNKIEKRRDNLAYNAIDVLIGFIDSDIMDWNLMKNEKKAMYLVDAILYNFPDGWRSVLSTQQKTVLEKFCCWYFDSDLYKSDWESTIKECSEYMERLHKQWAEKKK